MDQTPFDVSVRTTSLPTARVVAVGHTIYTIAYHLLADSSEYADLGPRYFDEPDQEHVTRRLVHRLEALGYSVQLQPSAA
jgi:hypothetical protein